MKEFLSLNSAHLYFLIFFSIANAVVLVIASYKYLQILQLSTYHARGVFTWLKESKYKHFKSLFFIGLIGAVCQLVVNLVFLPFEIGQYLAYIAVVVYFVLMIRYIASIRRVKLKKPLRYTKRMSRLCVFLGIVITAITFGLALLFVTNNVLRFIFAPFVPLILHY